MADKGAEKSGTVRILGAESSGVTKKIAEGVSQKIRAAYRGRGERVRLKGMRFLPSTKIELGDGTFQVMANTVVEVSGGSNMQRSEAIDSVVTVQRKKHEGQVLESVKIPYLEQRVAAAG
jgi:hypothetical protein